MQYTVKEHKTEYSHIFQEDFGRLICEDANGMTTKFGQLSCIQVRIYPVEIANAN